MSRTIASISAAILVVGGSLRLGAQQPTAAATRTEVQQAVRAYVDAFNRADVATLVEMYSREAGVTSVGDGQIMRGWDAIRSAFDSITGAEGKYKVSTGSVDIVPLGPSYALALTSTILTVKSGDQEAQLRGAMTLVFKKIGGDWKIIHDHTSTITPKSSGGGAGAAAPTVTPRPTRATERAAAAAQPAAPPAAAAAPTMTVGIADGRAVAIEPGKYMYYTFQLPVGTCTISGRITGISGGNKDFEAYIMDDDNFQNWSAGQPAKTYWQSGRVVVTGIDNTVLSGPGTYHLVLSNVWSVVSGKTVQPLAVAQCSM